jgi:hypothetical protein
VLKISVIDTPWQRKLVVEGKLIFPWAAELRTAYESSAADLAGREIVIEIRDLMAVSQEGENVLLELMNKGVTFHSSGVFTRQVMKTLARRERRKLHQASK